MCGSRKGGLLAQEHEDLLNNEFVRRMDEWSELNYALGMTEQRSKLDRGCHTGDIGFKT